MVLFCRVSLVTVFRPKSSKTEKRVDRVEGMTKEGAIMGRKLSDLDRKEAKNPLELDNAVKRVPKGGVMPNVAYKGERRHPQVTWSHLLSLVEDTENKGGGFNERSKCPSRTLKDTPTLPHQKTAIKIQLYICRRFNFSSKTTRPTQRTRNPSLSQTPYHLTASPPVWT